jgi:hypothetical protein
MFSSRESSKRQLLSPSSDKRPLKAILSQSWWVLLFIAGCFFIYGQAMQKKGHVATALQEQLNLLALEKEDLLAHREDLVLQIQSQSDPAWIQLTLMKGLGLVPDGQVKIFFQPESQEVAKDGRAA